MNENNNENGNSQIPEVEELVIEDTDDAETIKTKVTEHNQKVKDRDDKVKEANAQLFARTKKAEGFELIDGKWVKPNAGGQGGNNDTKNSKDGLKPEDVITIMRNNVHEDDIAEIADYAKHKNISIGEALKLNIVKTILADNAEKRKTAEGSNTDAGRRGNSKLSDEVLLSNASKGIMPTTTEDIQRLTKLKLKEGRK